MAWNFTAYILWKYSVKMRKTRINFRDFVNFVFIELGKKQKLFFHEGEKDLYKDLKYLEDIGVIELKEDEENTTEIVVKDKLAEIAKDVEKFPKIIKTRLFEEYLRRIDNAVNTASNN